MIKKLLNFIKNRYREIVVITVIFLIIVRLSSSIIYEKNGKSSKIFMDFFLKAPEIVSEVKTSDSNEVFLDEKDKKIMLLEEENAKLRNEIIVSKLNKNQLNDLMELKKVLNFVDDKYDPVPITTKIIAKNDGKFFKIFTVAAGEDDGVKLNSIAVNEKGLIGRVYETSKNYSKVISIMDNKANVSFEVVEAPDERGILNQEIDLSYDETYIENQLTGYFFNINSPIEKGDIVVTSGMGLYPQAIPIGKVSNIIKDKQNLVKYVQVDPFVDFENLSIITLINPREIM